MRKLEPSDKEIFRTPIEDENLLIRMGTHNMVRELLYRVNNEFRSMNLVNQEKFITQLLDCIKRKKYKNNILRHVENLYNQVDKNDMVSALTEIISRNKMITNIKKTQDITTLLEKINKQLLKNKEIKSLPKEQSEQIISKMKNLIKIDIDDDIDQQELIIETSCKLKRKICFIDSTTKLPYDLKGKGNKVIILLGWDNKYFEMIGLVKQNKRCQWEFPENHPTIEKMEKYLQGDLFLKKYNYNVEEPEPEEKIDEPQYSPVNGFSYSPYKNSDVEQETVDNNDVSVKQETVDNNDVSVKQETVDNNDVSVKQEIVDNNDVKKENNTLNK
jgi:hypothetical protein